MKIVLIDLETGGLDPKYHEILEIGMIIFDSKTFQIYEEWTTKVKPLYPENIDPKAAAVNGYNEEEWKDAPDIIPVLMEFIQKTEGCIMMAYNISFDSQFIEHYLSKHEMKHKMSYQKMCLMSMAFAKIDHSKLFSWSLKTVATYLEVPREPKIHRALEGVRCEYGVYCKLMF